MNTIQVMLGLIAVAGLQLILLVALAGVDKKLDYMNDQFSTPISVECKGYDEVEALLERLPCVCTNVHAKGLEYRDR